MRAILYYTVFQFKKAFALASFLLFTAFAVHSTDYFYLHTDYSYTVFNAQSIEGASFNEEGLHTAEITFDLTPLGKRLFQEEIFSFPFLFPKITFLASPVELFSGANQTSIALFPTESPAMDSLIIEVPINYVKLSKISTIGAKFYFEKTNHYVNLNFQDAKTYYPWASSSTALGVGDTKSMHISREIYAALLSWQMPLISAEAGYFYMDYRKPYSAILPGFSVATAVVDSKALMQGLMARFSWQIPEDKKIFYGIHGGFMTGGGSIYYSKVITATSYFNAVSNPGLMQYWISANMGMNISEGISLRMELGYQSYVFQEKQLFTGTASGAADNTLMIQAGLLFYY